MPGETRLCPRCELVSVFVIEDIGDDGSPSADLPAFCANHLSVEKHGEFLEVRCPRCGASMFFVQHSNVRIGGVDILAESWICECGATVEMAKDPDIA